MLGRWDRVPVQCVSLTVRLARDSVRELEGAAAWKFEIQINITERGIVNARHRATPALPYTCCLTHPDVYPLVSRGRDDRASRVYIIRVQYLPSPVESACRSREAFNEMTLILLENRHRRLRFQ